MSRILAVLALFLAFQQAAAETLEGKVIAIADGDTVTVLDRQNIQHKIRVAGIDAPESKQPFYQASRRNLSTLVFGKEVRVEWDKRDRYDRIVGKVLIGGDDAGLAQIRAGLAWWFKRYANEQSLADRSSYQSAEAEARGKGQGLWQQPDAVPPWEWRSAKKTP